MRRPPQLIVSEKLDRTDSAGKRKGGRALCSRTDEGGRFCLCFAGGKRVALWCPCLMTGWGKREGGGGEAGGVYGSCGIKNICSARRKKDGRRAGEAEGDEAKCEKNR